MASGTRKKQRTIIESDDESNSADKHDQDWTPGDEDVENNTNRANGNSNHTSSFEEIEFDSTEGFQLKIVKKMKQSNHLIWNHFGYLMKDGKIIKKCEKKIYCVKCFDKKTFKG